MPCEWIDLGNGRKVFREVRKSKPKRSTFPAPYTVTDVMEPTQHMCDGQYYTSKAKFREVTKAHGCVEVGNDPARFRRKEKPKQDRQAIRESIKKAEARYASGERPRT